MPDAVLCHVLTFLPSSDVIRTTRVSRLFRSVVYTDHETRAQLWRDPRMVLRVPPAMSGSTLATVLSRIGPNAVTAIDIGRRGTILDRATCEAIATHCASSLRSIGRLHANWDTTLRLLSRCQKLKHIDLDVPQSHVAEIDASRRQLPDDALKALERLDIQEGLMSSGATDAIDLCAAQIVAAAPSLRNLQIKRRVASPANLHPVMARGAQLRRIQIRATLIPDLIESLCHAGHRMPHLEEVVLAGICDPGAAPTAATAPRTSVRKLVLSSRTLQAHQMNTLAHYFPRVRHLRLGILERSTMHETLSATSRHFTEVERIELHLDSPRFATRRPASLCASHTVRHVSVFEAPPSVASPPGPRDAPPPPLVDAVFLSTCLGAFRNLQTLTYNGELCFSHTWARERRPVPDDDIPDGEIDASAWGPAYPCEPLRSLVPASAILTWHHLQRCGADRSYFTHAMECTAVNAAAIAGSAAIIHRCVLSPGRDFRDAPTLHPDVLSILLNEMRQTTVSGGQSAPSAPSQHVERAYRLALRIIDLGIATPNAVASAIEGHGASDRKRKEREGRLAWAHDIMRPYASVIQQIYDKWFEGSPRVQPPGGGCSGTIRSRPASQQ